MAFDVPCIGSVHVNHAKDILASGVKGVFMVGCEEETATTERDVSGWYRGMKKTENPR